MKIIYRLGAKKGAFKVQSCGIERRSPRLFAISAIIHSSPGLPFLFRPNAELPRTFFFTVPSQSVDFRERRSASDRAVGKAPTFSRHPAPDRPRRDMAASVRRLSPSPASAVQFHFHRRRTHPRRSSKYTFVER